MDLPDNVLEALRGRQKIKAIMLLRKQRGIGLKEAKDIVDQHLSNDERANRGEQGHVLNRNNLLSTMLI